MPKSAASSFPLTPSDWAGQAQTSWEKLLATPSLLEAEYQSFLEAHPAFLPGAFGEFGPGGQHGPLHGSVFTQPPLLGLGSTGRVPDFMWIVRSTVDITAVLIEIEQPSKRWFNQDGSQTSELTQAQHQLSQWKAWFKVDSNRSAFRDAYRLNRKWADRELHVEFVLIYGRHADFEDPSIKGTLRERLSFRNSFARDHEHFRTFDSLRWEGALQNAVTSRPKADGTFSVTNVPPTFQHVMSPGQALTLGPIDEAIAKQDAIPPSREATLRERWREDAILGRRLELGLYDKPDTRLGARGRELTPHELAALARFV